MEDKSKMADGGSVHRDNKYNERSKTVCNTLANPLFVNTGNPPDLPTLVPQDTVFSLTCLFRRTQAQSWWRSTPTRNSTSTLR